jgi:hypothetical protein
MIVYITTNLINGKKYIGKDENNINSYIGSGIEISNAIKKYGRKNFIKEILAECENSEQLNELEIYYIEYFNAQKSDLFYNIAPGGTGGKVAKNYKYREIPVLEINPINFDVVNKYKSSKEASIENNLNYKCLNAVCNKKKRSIKNRIFVFEKDYNKVELMNSFIPIRQKFIHLSYKTGIYYFKLIDLYEAEFKSRFKTFDAFINYSWRNKEIFKDQFLTERV